MSEARSVSFGLDFLTDSSAAALNGIVGQLGQIGSSAGDAEGDAESLADSLTQVGKAGEAAFGDVKEEAEGLGEKVSETTKKSSKELSDLGRNAKGIGDAFTTVATASLKAGNSITKSVGTGIAGAAKNAVVQIKGIGKQTATTAKDMGNAILHPIKTIRGNLIKSLDEAEEETEELGKQSKSTGEKLKDMGTKGSSAGDGLAKSIKGIVAAVVSVAAITASIGLVKDFIGASLQAAGAAETVTAQIDVAFGAGSAGAAAWADNYSSAVHRSTTEVKGFLSEDMNLYKSMGLTGEAAESLSKVTTSLGYDIGAAFKMDDVDAHNKLREAITGNTKAAQELGLSLGETELQQTALSMGIKTGIKDMDDATLAQVRLNTILAQTGDIQQAAANGTGGMANGIKSLTGIWDNFMAQAGAKFMPLLDKLFGTILDAWPTVEPMLMGLVDILSSGLSEAMPIVLQLAQAVLPILVNNVGKILTAVMPIIPVAAQLIGTLLPPLADLLGTLAATILPPLTDIFGVLVTDVLQPLLPVFMQLISTLLPPFVQLLGMVSPILGQLSPMLATLAQMLVPIAGVLGDLIGSLLPPLMGVLNTIFESVLMPLMPILMQLITTLLPPIAQTLGLIAPILEVISPIIAAMTPLLELSGQWIGLIAEALAKVIGWLADGIGAAVNFFGNLFGGAKDSQDEIDGLSGSVKGLTDATSEAPELGIDTSSYTGNVTKAADIASDAIGSSMSEAREVTDINFTAMGMDAKTTYGNMTLDAETAWERMTRAAEDGAAAIARAFGEIADAALGVGGANISVTGVDIPHHATGTLNYPGGATYIHEQGDEVAIMPSGSKILTADQSDRLISGMSRGGGRAVEVSVAVNVYGNADTSVLDQIKQIVKDAVDAALDAREDDDATLDAIQFGVAR